MMMKSFCMLSLILGGCALPGTTQTGGDDDGHGGGGTTDTGTAWKAMPLVDEPSVPRAGNDLVTGIYYASPDDGYVVTQGAGESSSDGGAVFKATSHGISSLAFSGKDGGPSLVGTVDFTGIEPAPGGYVAMAYSADVIASADNGATFTIAKDGGLAGIEPILATRASGAGTTIVRDTGVVSVASSMPGPAAHFTDVWAPNATQPIPDPVPDDQCQGGPLGTGAPVTHASAFISADAGLIAYTSAPHFDPQVCISIDHGHSFRPGMIPSVSDDAAQFPPTGVTFSSATTGIAWWAAPTEAGAAYIARTTNAGKTWTQVALPADLASHGLELNGAFFAPDGQHGWIAGFDHDADGALLLATTDGGATWTIDDSDVAAAVDAVGGGALYTGFALDASHVWVGGKNGVVLALAK